MTDGQLVQRASGVLRVFNEAGVLAAADVHTALRLAKLAGEGTEEVLLATALVVRAVRSGSVCLDLTKLSDISVETELDIDISELPWPQASRVVEALRSSRLVVGGPAGPLRPLHLAENDEGALLYLSRYYLQENMIRQILDERTTRVPAFDPQLLERSVTTLFRDSANSAEASSAPDRQRVAAALAVTRLTTIIVGGPGTGKTHTIARILALLVEQHGPSLRIGLTAPTGKAAARLEESVAEQAPMLGLPTNLKAMTLHRLLGWKPGSRNRFRHDASNRLPYDVVIVDETSMVSLTMMCRLLEAVRPDARLVLVGDPDQLTSVDAGAVLADLVARPVVDVVDPVLIAAVHSDLSAAPDPRAHDGGSVREQFGDSERARLGGGVVRLNRGRRFGGLIGRLAAAVRDGNADEVMALLQSGSDAVSFHPPGDIGALRSSVVSCAAAVTTAALAGDATGALRALETHRLLCAHRDGPYGVRRWAVQAMDWVAEATDERLDAAVWFAGQPLLVTANDYESKIFNGDTGVVISQEDGGLAAAFARAPEPFLISPSRLSGVQTVYAMTIHRSQGSQYDAVSVLLPAEASSLLTRELLYTAITRARTHVRVIASEESVRAGVERRVLRASGLRRSI